MNNYFFYKTITNQPVLTSEEQLFLATQLSDLKKIKKLITSGVNVNAVDANGITPLISAIIRWGNLRYFQRERIRNIDEARMHTAIEIVEQLIIAVLLENMDADKHYYFCEETAFLLWDNCKIKIEQEVESFHKITFGAFSLWALYKEQDANQLATLSRNETVKKIITEPNFKEKYPCFGDKAHANFQKGLARANMLDTALNSLVSYNTGSKLLPAECWMKILKQLDQDDLKNVTKSIFFKEASSTQSSNIMSIWKRMSSFVFRAH